MNHDRTTGHWRISIATVLTTVALTLAACSTPAPEPSDAAGEPSGPLSSLTIGYASQIGTLSVNQEAGIANYHLAALFQQGLLGLDDQGSLIPALAESWDSTDDSTWVFTIRQDVTFHDGTELTVDDILYSIEMARDPGRSPGVSIYWPSYISSVEQTGDWEITISLDGEHPDFGAEVSNAGGLFVTSREFAEAAANPGSPADLLVGTGPYRVTEFDPASHVTLERFDDYWGENEGPAQVRVDFIADDSTRLLAFQDGSIQASLSVPLEQADQWSTTEGAQVQFFSDRSWQGLMIDTNVAPFDDIHVRNAVAHAVDSASIVDGLLGGHAAAATGIDSPEQLAPLVGLEAAQEAVAALPVAAYSLDAAREELAASSVPDGFSTTLTYPTGYPAVGKASLALADSLGEAGIEVQVSEIPLEQWLGEIGGGNGLGWMIYGPTTPTPNEITSWLLAADGPGANPVNWTNADVSALNASIGTIADPQEKLDAIVEATGLAIEERIYVPVYWGQAAVATGSGIGVAEFSPYTLLTNWAADFSAS